MIIMDFRISILRIYRFRTICCLTKYGNKLYTFPYAGIWQTVLNALGKGLDKTLAYIGPGPHVPLFTAKFRFRFESLEKVLLIDLNHSILKNARRNSEKKFRTINSKRIPQLNELDLDVTGGYGELFSNSIHDALEKSSSLSELHEIFQKNKTFIDSIFSDKNRAAAEAYFKNKTKKTETYSIVYSEMVASFTGTAPVMAFRSKLFSKYPAEKGHSETLHIMFELTNIWKKYNEEIYKLHLDFLSDLTAPGGIVVMAVDTEKIFDDGEDPIASFPTLSPPEIELKNLTVMENLHVNPIEWRDHDFGFDISLYGYPINDFNPHKHKVYVQTFQKS